MLFIEFPLKEVENLIGLISAWDCITNTHKGIGGGGGVVDLCFIAFTFKWSESHVFKIDSVEKILKSNGVAKNGCDGIKNFSSKNSWHKLFQNLLWW